MKIIHVKLARSIWLFDLQDLNPSGKDIIEELVGWIKEGYDFKIAPDPAAAMSANRAPLGGPGNQGPSGILFQNGRFQAREEVFVEISSLTLFRDGIVVDTPSSTLHGDQFAQGLLQTAAQQFALQYDEETVRKRLYVSELIVRSDLSLDVVNPRLTAFASRIREAFFQGSGTQLQAGGISFWSEPNDAGEHRIFSIERQLGKAFSERRYYSRAPLPTDEHLRLLEELEQSLGTA
jgi:hypothetical protein